MGKRFYSVSSIVVAICVLIALYLTLSRPMTTHHSIAARAVSFSLSVSVPRPGEDSATYEAMQGDTVTLSIISDRSGQVHVHGYEKEIDLVPGREVKLTFPASYAGRFPIHLHAPDGAERFLGTLLIQPK